MLTTVRFLPPRITAGLLLLGSLASSGQTPLTGNLLVNPGAEAGNLSGWTQSGAVGYLADDGSYEAGFADGFSPYFGNYQFVAGANSGPSGTLFQSVSLASLDPGILTAIDAGGVRADISLWQKSLFQGGNTDYLRIRLEFEDAAHQSLGGFAGADLANLAPNPGFENWHPYSASQALPAGTREITYFIDSFRGVNGGNWIDTYSDDHQLVLSTIPEPAHSAALAAASLLVWSTARRLRRRPTPESPR